jgi:hypothetical protein
MDEIKAIVYEYDSDNIFNMDEMGIFYKLETNQTLATRRLSERKKQNEQNIVALTANATCTICLLPLIINQYLNPWAFTSRNIRYLENLGIKY